MSEKVFPQMTRLAHEQTWTNHYIPKYDGVGLTKRELFAAMAMQSVIQSLREPSTDGGAEAFREWMDEKSPESVARRSASYADALIAVLERKGSQ